MEFFIWVIVICVGIYIWKKIKERRNYYLLAEDIDFWIEHYHQMYISIIERQSSSIAERFEALADIENEIKHMDRVKFLDALAYVIPRVSKKVDCDLLMFQVTLIFKIYKSIANDDFTYKKPLNKSILSDVTYNCLNGY